MENQLSGNQSFWKSYSLEMVIMENRSFWAEGKGVGVNSRGGIFSHNTQAVCHHVLAKIDPQQD